MRKISICLVTLMLILGIPILSYASDISIQSQLMSYDYSGCITKIYCNSTFSTNGSTIGLNYRQWSSYGYPFTMKYTVCKKGILSDTNYCSKTTSVSNENGPSAYLVLGTAPTGTNRYLKIENVYQDCYVSGYGELYQN